MLKYKIMILVKLFVLNCVLIYCVYGDTTQVEVVVVCLLVSRDQHRQLYEHVCVNVDGCTGPSRSNAKHQSTMSRGSAKRRYFEKWLISTHLSCSI
jgi:hypothetical protein